ncbi:hypothetical protein [Amycolatopsis sp. cmx-11-51]
MSAATRSRVEQLLALTRKPAEHRAVLGGEVLGGVPSGPHAFTTAH